MNRMSDSEKETMVTQNGKFMPYSCPCGAIFPNSQKKAAHCKKCNKWRAENEPSRSRVKLRKKKIVIRPRGEHGRSQLTHKIKTRGVKRTREKITPSVPPVEGEESSDEERSFKKSLKRRMQLEQAERIAIRETREKFEQQQLNRQFFGMHQRKFEDGSTVEERTQYEKLITANLFEEQPIPEDYEEPAEQPKRKMDLPIPAFREMEDYHVVDNQVKFYDDEFYKFYKTGKFFVAIDDFHPPEGKLVTPTRPTSSPSGNGGQHQHPHQQVQEKEKHTVKRLVRTERQHGRIFKFFDVEQWTEEETLLFRELLFAYGQDWDRISLLMQSKTAAQLEQFYVNNSYDIYCQICGTSDNDDLLLLCDSCDRAYHTFCLNPPLEAIPNTEWYCSPDCRSLKSLKCEVCHRSEDDDKMLLCDRCDNGFHMYCLNPPLQSIPESEWICGNCLSNKKVVRKKKIAPKKVVTESNPQADVDHRIADISTLVKDAGTLKPQLKKRVEKLGSHLLTNVVYQITIPELKGWCFSQIDDIHMDFLRENNLPKNLNFVSLFKDGPLEVAFHKANEHFGMILEGVNQVVDNFLRSVFPTSSKEEQNDEIQQQPLPPPVQTTESPKPTYRSKNAKKNSPAKPKSTPVTTPKLLVDSSMDSPLLSMSSPLLSTSLLSVENHVPSSSSTTITTSSANGWLIRIHSSQFDLANALQSTNKLVWHYDQDPQSSVTIQPGDEVFLYFANLIDDSILARCTVLFPPTVLPELEITGPFRRYFLPPQSAQVSVVLHVEELFSKPLTKKDLLKNRFLTQLPLFSQPLTDIFLLTPIHYATLHTLIHGNKGKQTPFGKKKSTPKKSTQPGSNSESPTSIITKSSDSIDQDPTDLKPPKNPAYVVGRRGRLPKKMIPGNDINSSDPKSSPSPTLSRIQKPGRGRPRKKQNVAPVPVPKHDQNESHSQPEFLGDSMSEDQWEDFESPPKKMKHLESIDSGLYNSYINESHEQLVESLMDFDFGAKEEDSNLDDSLEHVPSGLSHSSSSLPGNDESFRSDPEIAATKSSFAQIFSKPDDSLSPLKEKAHCISDESREDLTKSNQSMEPAQLLSSSTSSTLSSEPVKPTKGKRGRKKKNPTPTPKPNPKPVLLVPPSAFLSIDHRLCPLCHHSKTESDKIATCLICNHTFHVDCLASSGASCSSKFLPSSYKSTNTNPSLKPPRMATKTLPFPPTDIHVWICNTCTKFSPVCVTCIQPESEAIKIVFCSSCQRPFHSSIQCLGTNPSPNSKIFCDHCHLKPQEILLAKFSLGLREIQAECRRLIQIKCQQMCAKLKHHIMQTSSEKKVFQQYRDLTSEIIETRMQLLQAADSSFQIWKKSLLLLLSSKEPK